MNDLFKKAVKNLRLNKKVFEPNLTSYLSFLVAKKKIKKGETFSFENITSKRTGGGIASNLFSRIKGKKAKRNFNIDEIISR